MDQERRRDHDGERYGCRGQITLFLSLMLMILISFLCTALRSAQTAGSRYLFTLATEATARSVFGAYDTRVWEQYRVLMLTDQELAEKIGQECKASYEKNGTLFPVQITSLRWRAPVTLADNGADGWEAAMISYMEARLPIDLVSHWVEQIDLLAGLEEVTQWFTGFRDILKPLIQLEQKLCKLEKKLSQAVKTYERGKSLLGELGSCCESIQQQLTIAQEGGTLDEVAFEEAWAALEESYAKIQQYIRDSGWELASIVGEVEDRMDEIIDLGDAITGLLDSLTGEDDWSLSALADLGGYLSGLTKRLDILKRLPEDLTVQREHLQRISLLTLPTMQEVLEGAGEAVLVFLQGMAEGFVQEVWDPEHLDMEEGSTEDTQRVTVLMQLKNWLDQGILSLVLEDPGRVSQATLGRVLERSQRQNSEKLLEEAYRQVLCGEYALRYTARYGQNGDEGGLRYETEYVIAGKTEDSANLAAVASRLLLTRGALNLLYLLQNSGSQDVLHAAAVGLSAALGGWIPPGLMSVLLMVVWSMAEAVCDVRALLAGKQVPFWKDRTSWKLAFEHVWTLLDGDFVMGLDRSEGMDYGEYLRLLLFLVPTQEKCYRIMEVAEENLRVERPTFCIDAGWCRAELWAMGQAAGRQTQLRLSYGY